MKFGRRHAAGGHAVDKQMPQSWRLALSSPGRTTAPYSRAQMRTYHVPGTHSAGDEVRAVYNFSFLIYLPPWSPGVEQGKLRLSERKHLYKESPALGFIKDGK